MTRKITCALAATVLTGMASATYAEDGETPLRDDLLATPCLTATGALDAVRDLARAEASAASSAERRDDAETVELEAEPAPGVISEVLENDGLPLVKLSDEADRKKIYFGISLDGVVGVHGKL